MARFWAKVYFVLTVPVSILFILNSKRIHPSYRMSLFTKLGLGFRMFLNTLRILTGTSYKCHLSMALKLLELPPGLPGDVIECGAWNGGSSANLSLICRIVGRRLKVYDSFEGLPEGDPEDREAKHYKKGDFYGPLDEVRSNIQRYGAIECCEFIKGWFKDTLPALDAPVALAFLDVDLEASLDTCVRHIWPRLVEGGFIFIDEFHVLDYCALFYSEEYWRRYFHTTPPGLMGAGIGLAVGDYYVGPLAEKAQHPLQHENAGAYVQKGMSAVWTYFPEQS